MLNVSILLWWLILASCPRHYSGLAFALGDKPVMKVSSTVSLVPPLVKVCNYHQGARQTGLKQCHLNWGETCRNCWFVLFSSAVLPVDPDLAVNPWPPAPADPCVPTLLHGPSSAVLSFSRTQISLREVIWSIPIMGCTFSCRPKRCPHAEVALPSVVTLKVVWCSSNKMGKLSFAFWCA